MKKLVFAAMLACVSVVPAMADKVSTTETAEFKGLIDKCAAAWSSLNPDNVAPFYAKDADLVYYDLAPLKYTGWTEYDKGVREVFSTFETLAMTPGSDLKVSKSGKVAWTTVTYHASVKMKGAPSPMEMDARQTLIWEKRDGKWAIIHEHISAPLPPGPGSTSKSE